MYSRLMTIMMGIFLLAQSSFGQVEHIHRQEHESVRIYFRQGAHNIDESYMNNRSTLERFAQEVNSYSHDSTARFRQIRIVSSASPEGSKQINDRLVKQRAKAIADWISKKISLNIGYEVEQTEIDWEMLDSLVTHTPGVPHSGEVLEIIRHTPQYETDSRGATVNRRYNELKSLYNGESYNWIYSNLFPQMRYAAARVEFWWEAEPDLFLITESPMEFPHEGGDSLVLFEKNIADDIVPEAVAAADWIRSVVPGKKTVTFTVAPNPMAEPRSTTLTLKAYGKEYPVVINQAAAEPDTTALAETDTTAVEVDKKELKPFYMSLNTNMLYDLALIPNVGVEFYLGKNLSIDANWHYTWWKESSWNWFLRTYGGDLALHYWFGKAAKKKPLTGHHLGAYGQMLTYDIEFGKRGYLADRWSWAVGVEYGYSMPIARRLNIDFAMGFGYHWGVYDEYLPIDGHYAWQETNNRQYFGPTKVEVSLVWLLGRGNSNERKGGKQ